MSLASQIPTAILETILAHLATLFLTGAAGDITAARLAASQMVGAHRPETEDELRLAANVIGFSFHALEAPGQAAAPDIPLTRILRLRGSAVSLSRESEKAARRWTNSRKPAARAIRPNTSPNPPNPNQKSKMHASCSTTHRRLPPNPAARPGPKPKSTASGTCAAQPA